MTTMNLLYVVIAIMALVIIVLLTKRFIQWVLRKDQRMDEIQEKIIEAHGIFREYGLNNAEAVAKKAGAINLDGLVEALKETVNNYSTPAKAMLQLDECFGILLIKRSADPAWLGKTAKLIRNEQALVAELDRLESEEALAKRQAAIIKAALAKESATPATPPAVV